jgi:hypothetical protein
MMEAMSMDARLFSDLRADPFTQPELGRLMTQAFEILTVAIAVTFDEVDPDVASDHGMHPLRVTDVIERAAAYGKALVAEAGDDGVRLAQVWAQDWKEVGRDG